MQSAGQCAVRERGARAHQDLHAEGGQRRQGEPGNALDRIPAGHSHDQNVDQQHSDDEDRTAMQHRVGVGAGEVRRETAAAQRPRVATLIGAACDHRRSGEQQHIGPNGRRCRELSKSGIGHARRVLHRHDRGRDQGPQDDHRQSEVECDQPGRQLLRHHHAAKRALCSDRDQRGCGKPSHHRSPSAEQKPRTRDRGDDEDAGDRADGAVRVLDDRVQIRRRVGTAVAERPVGASKPGA